MSLRLVTAGTSPAVSLAEAKKHVHAEFYEDDDAYLTALVAAATRSSERWLGIAIANQTWELRLDDFPDGKIVLPRSPLVSVDSVEFDDEANAETAYEDFREFGVATEDAGYIMPAIDEDWPATNGEPECVRITFTAGLAAVVPDIKHALLLLVGDWFEHREDAVEAALKPMPNSAAALLMSYRNWSA
jgi:uncharacterized phiE125 gp8 family phage protein